MTNSLKAVVASQEFEILGYSGNKNGEYIPQRYGKTITKLTKSL